jgi:tight adherence protein C
MATTLLLGLACVAVAVLLIALALADVGSDSAVRRSLTTVAALGSRRPSVREQELNRPFVDRVLDPTVAWFVRLGRRFTPEDGVHRIKSRLDQAGNPSGWDPDRLLGVKALAALVGLLCGFVGPLIFSVATPAWIAYVAAGFALGWYAPSIWLYQIAATRGQTVRSALPDALDLLTISVESGLSFDAALSQVATKTTGPLAGEFLRVLGEIQIGTGRVEAMRALAERTDVPELRSFIGAMIQADAFGVPIAGVLRVQAKEMRVKRSQRAEEQAQKVPVKILFPLIFCLLPCLFLVILGPAAILASQMMTNGRR